MGTSKGFPLPTGGNWTDLKREATQYVQSGSSQAASDVSRLLGKFIDAHGGASAWATGGGSRGVGTGSSAAGSSVVGHAARRTGRNLGGFLSGISSGGLARALEGLGLEDLVGRSVAEIGTVLLDRLAGPASTLDSAAVRAALTSLNFELFGAAKIFEEMERLLNQALDTLGLARILMRFFALYLYEYFCRFFYDTWAKKVGEVPARRTLRTVKSVIDKALKAKVGVRDVRRVNWSGPEGKRLAEDILKDTLDIFGATK